MSTAPRPLALLVGGLMLPLSLVGCGGTPFGDALSDSFSGFTNNPDPSLSASPTPAGAAPVGASPVVTSATGKAPGETPPTDQPPGEKPPADSRASVEPGIDPVPTLAAPKAPSSAQPSSPPTAPALYRVTIQLPRADPSAPAEVVTQALRAAGVPFEVEAIERMVPEKPTGDGQTPKPPQPALKPRPAPTP